MKEIAIRRSEQRCENCAKCVKFRNWTARNFPLAITNNFFGVCVIEETGILASIVSLHDDEAKFCDDKHVKVVKASYGCYAWKDVME
jgi:hypothetical protein